MDKFLGKNLQWDVLSHFKIILLDHIFSNGIIDCDKWKHFYSSCNYFPEDLGPLQKH